jgi:hypothetical protein
MTTLRDLRGRRPQLLLLALLPLIAGLITLGYAVRQPTRYTATATVFVPSFYPTSGPNAITQSVAQFRAAVTSAPVAQWVAEHAKVSRQAVVDGTSVGGSADGGGNIVTVSYRSTDPTKVNPVLDRLVERSVQILQDPMIRDRQQRLETREEALAKAKAKHDRIAKQLDSTTGQVLPLETYHNKQSELTQLRVQLERAKAEGQVTRVAALQQVIADVQAQLPKLAAEANDYKRLANEADRAAQEQTRAEKAVQEATLSLRAGRQAAQVTVTPTTKIAPLPGTVRLVATAIAVALVLTIGLLLLLRVLLGPPAPRRPRSTHPTVWNGSERRGSQDREAQHAAGVNPGSPPPTA